MAVAPNRDDAANDSLVDPVSYRKGLYARMLLSDPDAAGQLERRIKMKLRVFNLKDEESGKAVAMLLGSVLAMKAAIDELDGSELPQDLEEGQKLDPAFMQQILSVIDEMGPVIRGLVENLRQTTKGRVI